jgi:hypothetical protein
MKKQSSSVVVSSRKTRLGAKRRAAANPASRSEAETVSMSPPHRIVRPRWGVRSEAAMIRTFGVRLLRRSKGPCSRSFYAAATDHRSTPGLALASLSPRALERA